MTPVPLRRRFEIHNEPELDQRRAGCWLTASVWVDNYLIRVAAVSHRPLVPRPGDDLDAASGLPLALMLMHDPSMPTVTHDHMRTASLHCGHMKGVVEHGATQNMYRLIMLLPS